MHISIKKKKKQIDISPIMQYNVLIWILYTFPHEVPTMQNKRRILAAVFASLLLLQSCGSATETTETTEQNSTETTADTETLYPDALPEDLDYNGESVTFLYRDEVSDEFFTDALNGDVVNDAQYNSIQSTEERLNVDIVLAAEPGHLTSVRQTYMNGIINTIQAGDDVYDWVDLMIGNSPILMRDGLFYDVLQNPYIDLTQPWYLSNLVETLAIDDHLYFLSGDASLGYLKCAFCIYFNKQLAEDYSMDSFYDLVDEGNWTMDTLMELASVASLDVDGDGKYKDDDKLGFLVHDWNHPKGFWAATGTAMYTQDSDGNWQFTFGSEKDVDVCNKIYTLFYQTAGSYFPGITNAVEANVAQYNALAAKFASGEVLFMTAEMDDAVTQLREMEDPYGILPYPKFNEEQANYCSSSRNTHNAFSMPVTCGDIEMAGAVMEALSSSNYQTVVPAYFETALKVKYAHDDDTARMYDLIRETMILDFGYIYGNAIGSPEGVFFDSFKKENSLASNVASKQKSLDTALATYLETLRKNCGH